VDVEPKPRSQIFIHAVVPDSGFDARIVGDLSVCGGSYCGKVPIFTGVFAALSALAQEDIEINSTCVVFAESEIVSLLARGAKRESIIKALHGSVARRAIGLLGREAAVGSLWLDGGPAQNAGLIATFEDELMAEVQALPEPLYTVADGAAVSLN
jgi:activator of 2-hydroxyglutaryl-CoA dehydratase